METEIPLISVFMPVYNGAKHVRAAIDSVLAQTFRDFELIVIDDGSTDDTVQVISSIPDPRIRLVRQEKNTGIAIAANRGVMLARGKYIARHDHDDLSAATRFEKQVAFLEAHPDHALLGTCADIWEIDQPTQRSIDPPIDEGILLFDMLSNNCFVHSSVMMRRNAVVALGGYSEDPSRYPPEDYELWCRIARKHKIANLPERLVTYREVPTSVCRTTYFQDKVVKICSENFAYAIGLESPTPDTRNIAALIHHCPELLVGRPHYQTMREIILRAGENINKISPGGGARAATLATSLIWPTCENCLPVYMRKFFLVARTTFRKVSWLRPVRRLLISCVERLLA